MEYHIALTIRLSEKLGLKGVSIDLNTTDLPSDSKLLSKIAVVLLRAISLNADDMEVQDLLTELGIEKETNNG